MSVSYPPEKRKKAYDETYAKMKSEGLSDRDADIMTNAKMYPRVSFPALARKHRMEIEEVEAVYKAYYNGP